MPGGRIVLNCYFSEFTGDAVPHPLPSCLSRAAAFLPAALLLALAGCATAPGPATAPAATGQPALSYQFVLLGEQGAAVARLITAGTACPSIEIDGTAQPMAVRAPAATIALRPTALPVAESKPSAFPLLTCEAALPAGTRSASILGQPLALPKASLSRIVVLGDTGCRLQRGSNGSPGAFQNCNSPIDYPFAQVARSAADWKPDLVIHVGDYHYRETPCPANQRGCAGSPNGYGWDTWQADLFEPGRALLQAAPWVAVRGNHESCVRGGQGFWRFLDPRPLLPGRDCNDAIDDPKGDFSDPYAVPLGGKAQLVVLDTAVTANNAFAAGDPRTAKYVELYAKAEQLTLQADYNIGTMHHPLLAFVALPTREGEVLKGGNGGLIGAWTMPGKPLLPSRFNSVLSGHVHMWQQVSFASAHPTQFVSGFSGTQEETVPLPNPLPPHAEPAPGAVVASISSWFDGFGFMTMERQGADAWDVKVWDAAGALKNTCKVKGNTSQCELGAIPPPAKAAVTP
jgi:hypothetical protein